VIVTLNSDDPSMFGGWADRVYAAARDTWTFSDDVLAELAAASVRASFADDGTKAILLAGIDRWLASPV
jgi:adenosine deaminase